MRRKRVVVASFEVVGEIDSLSEPGILHVIKRRVSTGTLSCDCMAWRFSRGEKRCKHVDAYQASTLREQVRETIAQFREIGIPLVSPTPLAQAVDYTEQPMPRPGVRRLRLRD